MIQTILWDVDGTLLNFQAAERVALRACFERFSLGECTDAMLERYSALNLSYWKRLERGEISKPALLTGRFLEFFAQEGLPTEQAAAFNEEYQVRLGDCICFNDQADKLVASLKGRVRQCVVTNGTQVAQKRKLARSGLDALMDAVFISDELGVEKPDPGFFEKVWAALGPCRPEETLIVGDSLTSDIQGGVNAGIKTCWYNPARLPRPAGLPVDYEIADLRALPDILAQEAR